VLVASLSMPLLMHWITLTITVQPASESMPAPEILWPDNGPPLQLMQPLLPSEFGAAAVLRETTSAFDWQLFATAVYALVAGMLLLRLAAGLYMTWRMAQAAQPILEPWTVAADVRVSQVISRPVTFGSTILLPPQYLEWDLPKRQAVLAHEGAHVAHDDFYVLLLAAVNRAVFWFSPLVWWQLVRLAELAEIISDARALEIVEDKLFYAEILLDLVQHVRQAPASPTSSTAACSIHVNATGSKRCLCRRTSRGFRETEGIWQRTPL
jgi:bla regulator protein blaR1